MTQAERIVWELAGFGNLFLVLTLPEIRREGMTYLSLCSPAGGSGNQGIIHKLFS